MIMLTYFQEFNDCIRHTPLLLQGLLIHTLIKVSQRCPVQPATHEHKTLLSSGVQL